MPALNFKKQFMSAVLNGTKCQTIRATRKHPIKVGDALYLYTGMRTKQCLRLRVTKCTRVEHISINTAFSAGTVRIGPRYLLASEIDAMARADGFPSTKSFMDFFTENHGPNFKGQLIEWNA